MKSCITIKHKNVCSPKSTFEYSVDSIETDTDDYESSGYKEKDYLVNVVVKVSVNHQRNYQYNTRKFGRAWFNALVLKTSVGNTTESSNPSISAKDPVVRWV